MNFRDGNAAASSRRRVMMHIQVAGSHSFELADKSYEN